MGWFCWWLKLGGNLWGKLRVFREQCMAGPRQLILDSLILDSLILDSLILDSLILDSLILDSCMGVLEQPGMGFKQFGQLGMGLHQWCSQQSKFRMGLSKCSS
jgi:hypothetical protein